MENNYSGALPVVDDMVVVIFVVVCGVDEVLTVVSSNVVDTDVVDGDVCVVDKRVVVLSVVVGASKD